MTREELLAEVAGLERDLADARNELEIAQREITSLEHDLAVWRVDELREEY